MDITILTGLISNLGFPIVACVFMAWYCTKQIQKQHDTISELTKVVQANTTAIINLTRSLMDNEKED